MSGSEHWKAGREGRDFQAPSGNYDKFRDAERQYQLGKENKASSDRAIKNYIKSFEGSGESIAEGISGLFTMFKSIFGIFVISFVWLVLPFKSVPRVCKNILMFLGVFLVSKFLVYLLFSLLWSVRLLYYNNIQFNFTREITAAIISVLVVRYMNKISDKNTIYEEHFSAADKAKAYFMTAFKGVALLCVIGLIFRFLTFIGFDDFNSYTGLRYSNYLRYIF